MSTAPALAANMPGLVRSYLAAIRRGSAGQSYAPRAAPLWSVQDALGRLGAMIGKVPDWSVLERFLPEAVADPVARRAAVASTLLAGLELARDGQLRLRQDHPFGAHPAGGGGAMNDDHIRLAEADGLRQRRAGDRPVPAAPAAG